MPARIIAYGVAGLAGTLLHYATLALLVQAFHVEPVAGSTAGAAVGAAVNYGLNYRFTFRSAVPHRQAFARFLAVALAGMIVNAAVLAAAVYGIGLHYLLGQLAATGAAFLATYEMNSRWTF